MKKIIILGSTGSIGTQSLDVARENRGIRVVGLSANANVEALKGQIAEFRPKAVAVGDDGDAVALRDWCRVRKFRVKVLSGDAGLCGLSAMPGADMVLSAVVGAVGIGPLVAAIRSGKDVAFANKEALIAAGGIVMREARRNRVRILPVDSEHSAIFQCLKDEDPRRVKRLILTASGGPFYRSKKRLSEITVADALAHPTWIMGRKITVDSATLMNKGLEAIEAHHLFGLPMERIDIVIHPQSIVHSMVEYVDGTVLAQLSNPDMRLPIQYALTYPDRVPSSVPQLDLARVGALEFGEPDFHRFPCLDLALCAGRTGGTLPAVMNAANETAVRGFLDGRIGFDAIADIIGAVMKEHRVRTTPSLKDILDHDAAARVRAAELIEERYGLRKAPRRRGAGRVRRGEMKENA